MVRFLEKNIWIVLTKINVCGVKSTFEGLFLKKGMHCAILKKAGREIPAYRGDISR